MNEDKQPCCEGERQYLELINKTIPSLGMNAMSMFVDSGFSIPAFVEALWNKNKYE